MKFSSAVNVRFFKMSKAVKNRKEKKTLCGHLYGCSKELPVAELPTNRDIIQYIMLLRERSIYGTPMEQVSTKVRELWTKANILFVPPVTISEQRLQKRLDNLWESANLHAWGKLSQTKQISLMNNIDNLFDILTCKCPIFECDEVECDKTCSQKLHLHCPCPKKQKIPRSEIEFITGQRKKIGTVGPHQMATVDRAATKAYNNEN